jgi:hypothetical protein
MRGRGDSLTRVDGRAAGQMEIAEFHWGTANVAGRRR